MKKLTLVWIISLFLVSIMSLQAQRVVKVYPKHGVVVTKIHKPKLVRHQGKAFHFSRGVWYAKHNRGFVVVAAPKGIRIKRLPRGYTKVVVNGHKFYRFNNVLYKRHRGYYIVA
ncbi:hypothetical protein PP178_12045 [Zeaxanthinibacter sp. PT1]|uniref:DUF6515 family protein n=1 Tax=Zeaxanthinibacter TaxID=561554 RepID=UPI002349107E|nr:DUF6515 family protein [Zeaxanthinibacter sp. PT1]MDC6352285.1 hypothetical protein [Zeaxanthinibacter sp. PT1]